MGTASSLPDAPRGALTGTLALCYLLPVAAGTPFAGLMGIYRIVGPFLVWRFSYVVLSGKRGAAAQSRFRDHVFYCLPIWGGSNTPTGKGYDYFRQTRADAPEEIAASQLAGLKLIGLAWIWTGVRALMNAVVRGDAAPHMTTFLGGWHLGIPTLWRCHRGHGHGRVGRRERSASLGIDLIFVVTLRAAIARDTWPSASCVSSGSRCFATFTGPLLSTTLVEFWNRFNYYFKELLVDFFFFPTFLKAFKSPAAFADLRRDDGRRRRGKSLLPPHAGFSASVSDAFRRGRIVDRQPRALFASARLRHLRLHASGEGTSGKAVSARSSLVGASPPSSDCWRLALLQPPPHLGHAPAGAGVRPARKVLLLAVRLLTDTRFRSVGLTATWCSWPRVLVTCSTAGSRGSRSRRSGCPG